MSKTCIVTFATRGMTRYEKNLDRFLRQCKKHCSTIPVLYSLDYEEIVSPTHQESNYAFKAHMIKFALDKGFTKIIWADSAVFPVSDITPFLKWWEGTDVVFFDNIGFPLELWTSDACKEYYNLPTLEGVQQIMSCLFAFDINTPKGLLFWENFYKDLTNPILANGAWTNENNEVSQNDFVLGHRHDQTIASFIIAKYGLTQHILTAHETFFAYREWYRNTNFQISKTVCFQSESY